MHVAPQTLVENKQNWVIFFFQKSLAVGHWPAVREQGYYLH